MNAACKHLAEGAGAFRERDLRIPADLGMLGDARDWAAGAAADFGLGDDAAFEIRLATSEAVTNAIVHGSHSEADHISLEAREEAGALVFEVRDGGAHGAGIAQPRSSALDEGGRGLQLVEMVMDEVELTRRRSGSVLRFAKRRAA